MSNNIPSSDNHKNGKDSALSRRDFLISGVALGVASGLVAFKGCDDMREEAQEKHDELQEIFSRDFEYINDQFAENFLVSDRILSKNTMSKNTMEKIGYSTIVPVRDKDGNECSFIGIRNGVLTIESVDKEKSRIKLAVPHRVDSTDEQPHTAYKNVELNNDNLFVYYNPNTLDTLTVALRDPEAIDNLTVALRDDNGIPDLRNITFIGSEIRLDFSGIKGSPVEFARISGIFDNIASHQPDYKGDENGKQAAAYKMRKPQTIKINFSGKQFDELKEQGIKDIISPLLSNTSGYLLNIDIAKDSHEGMKTIRKGQLSFDKIRDTNGDIAARRGNLERYLNRGHETTISRT